MFMGQLLRLSIVVGNNFSLFVTYLENVSTKGLFVSGQTIKSLLRACWPYLALLTYLWLLQSSLNVKLNTASVSYSTAVNIVLNKSTKRDIVYLKLLTNYALCTYISEQWYCYMYYLTVLWNNVSNTNL